MINRIKIDGYKSFVDFQLLYVPRFLVLVGPNSSGKSNLFDALAFLKAAYANPEAALFDFDARRGRPQELFHSAEGSAGGDAFRIDVRTRSVAPGRGPVTVDHQLKAARRDGRYTVDGPNAQLEPDSALVQIGDVPDWVMTAALREVASWRFVMPEPRLMRRAAPAGDERPLTEDGSNLAAVLGRIAENEREAFDEILLDLVAMIPGVQGIEPRLDEHRQEWTLDIVFDGEGWVPSTLISDGTLRVLSILTALHDPDHPGVLLLEEIENGLHPELLAALVGRIKNRVMDYTKEPRQVIATTHSPVVVGELVHETPDALSFFETSFLVDPDSGRTSRRTVARPVRDSGERGTYVSPRNIRQYLGTVRRDAW